jgi:hypothetical protein
LALDVNRLPNHTRHGASRLHYAESFALGKARVVCCGTGVFALMIKNKEKEIALSISVLIFIFLISICFLFFFFFEQDEGGRSV